MTIAEAQCPRTGPQCVCEECYRLRPISAIVVEQCPTGPRLRCADADTCRFYKSWNVDSDAEPS